MYVVMNRIPINDQYWKEFAKMVKTRPALVDKSPGFIRNLILKPAGENTYHIIMTFWESKEAFDNWTQSEAFEEGHKRARNRPKDYYRGPPNLEMFEVITDTGNS